MFIEYWRYTERHDQPRALKITLYLLFQTFFPSSTNRSKVAYLPFPETSGQLPVTRYKVKVEHPGDSSNQVTQTPDITDAANTNDTTTTSNIPLDVDGVEGAENASAPPAADPDAGGDDSSFANPTLSKVVLVPSAGETNSASEGGRQKRTLVTVRGLRPATRYRVKVCLSACPCPSGVVTG